MKTFNFYITIICSLFLFMVTSCDQENIGEKYTLSNEGVAFLTGTSEIIASPDQTSTDYKIIRGNTQGRLELPLTATYDHEIFTLPSSVVFEDGSSFAVLTIPLENTVLGTSYPIVLEIDSVKASPYGKFKTTLNVMRDFNWISFGTAYWTDGVVAYIFGMPTDPYPVELQQADGVEGMFRMVNPYGVGVYEYTEEGDLVRDPSYIIIDATNPNQVYIKEQGLGIDYGYGEIYFVSYSPSGATRYGQLVGTTITFPSGTLAAGMRNYNGGVLTWLIDPCILEMGEPEVVYDYSAEIEYVGRFTNLTGDDFAIAEVELGEDVAYAKVGLVSGDLTLAALNGIVDGSIESEQITASGTVLFPFSETGIYTIIAITYDDNDADKEYGYATFDLYSSSGGGGKASIEDFYGNYNLTGKCLYASYGLPDANMSVSIEAGDEPNTLSISGFSVAWLGYTTENLTAIFDPATGYMSIPPQQLDDMYDEDEDEWYEMFLYTIDEDDYTTAPMTFSLTLSGQLVLAPNSEAIGYTVGDEEGDWDGQYNIVFTPQSDSKSAPVIKSSAPRHKSKIKKDMEKISIEKRVINSEETTIITKGSGVVRKTFNRHQIQPISVF